MEGGGVGDYIGDLKYMGGFFFFLNGRGLIGMREGERERENDTGWSRDSCMQLM